VPKVLRVKNSKCRMQNAKCKNKKVSREVAGDEREGTEKLLLN
jgi:hypothetical protein